MTTLASLLADIDQAIEDDDIEHATGLVLSNTDALVDDALLRERVGSILAAAGRNKEAVEVWDRVARHYANAGHPTRSLATIKQMHALQPDATVILDHFATLYSIKSPYLDESLEIPRFEEASDRTELVSDPDQDDERELDELLDDAHDFAIDEDGLVDEPDSIPRLPLLSLLPDDTLRGVLEHLEYEVFAQTQVVVEEGYVNPELLWTVSDDFTARTKGHEVPSRLPAGSLVGLNQFGPSATPSRTTIVSRKGSELLRLTGQAIEELDSAFGDFQNRLVTLRRHGLTEGLLERHPIFDALSRDERTEITDAFTGLRVTEGAHLVVQDVESPGLFLILDGRVDIVRNDEDWEITIGTLTAGDLFGEIGLVKERAATAGCIATTPGHLLFLPREEFDEMVETYPSMAKYAVNLASKRLEQVDSAVTANDLAEIDD